MSPRDERNTRKPPGTKTRSESSTRRPETKCTPESKKRARPDQRDRINSDYDAASLKRQNSHHKRHRKEEKHRAKKHHKYLTPDRSSPDVKQEPVMLRFEWSAFEHLKGIVENSGVSSTRPAQPQFRQLFDQVCALQEQYGSPKPTTRQLQHRIQNLRKVVQDQKEQTQLLAPPTPQPVIIPTTEITLQSHSTSDSPTVDLDPYQMFVQAGSQLLNTMADMRAQYEAMQRKMDGQEIDKNCVKCQKCVR